VTERTQWILLFSIATFVVVVFIAVILLRRHGHTLETDKILTSVEGMRQQNSAEHSAIQGEQRAQGRGLSKLLERFGFLKGRE
jgi:hypothetical protein